MGMAVVYWYGRVAIIFICSVTVFREMIQRRHTNLKLNEEFWVERDSPPLRVVKGADNFTTVSRGTLTIYDKKKYHTAEKNSCAVPGATCYLT